MNLIRFIFAFSQTRLAYELLKPCLLKFSLVRWIQIHESKI